MKIICIILIIGFSCSGFSQDLDQRTILGKWELDYSSLMDCEGNSFKPDSIEVERSLLEFYENGQYKRFVWGGESGGTYMTQKDSIEFSERYSLGGKEGNARGKYNIEFELLTRDTLAISFIECDTKVVQKFMRIDNSYKDINNWNIVKRTIDQMTWSTTYNNIITILGNPYEEFATPSLLEEYILYFNIGDDPDKMFWIMVDTETKHFLYWSGIKQPK